MATKASEVDSADKAAELALEVMRKAGWAFLFVSEAKLDTHNQIWLVKVESLTNVFMVKIDKRSGKILEISGIKQE